MPSSHFAGAAVVLIEALEPRIAPTGLVGLANNPATASNPNYLTYATVPTAGHLGFVPRPDLGPHIFEIQLSGDGSLTAGSASTGDQIQIFSAATGFSTFLQVTQGHVAAFFNDVNGDGQVQTNELVGLSIGNKARVVVNGSVNGDIVANLAPDNFHQQDSGGKLLKQSISGLTVSGNVNGNILAGYNLANMTVVGTVTGGVLTGSAANGVPYYFDGAPGGAPSGVYGAALTPVGRPGGSITNVTLGAVSHVQAGTGGLSASGGSIDFLTINGDTSGFLIQSGDGGASGGPGARAGNGGNIDNLTIGLSGGAPDTTIHSLVQIVGGKGGGSGGIQRAGNGGSLDEINFGFVSNSAGNLQLSASQLADLVVLQAGAGGDGFRAGSGGSVTNSQIVVGTPDIFDASGNLAADQGVVKIFGGDGGVLSGGSRGGSGGSITNVAVSNLDTDATLVNGLPAATNAQATQLVLQAGSGGAVQSSGLGQDGGSVNTVSLLGYHLSITAGDGASGGRGGGTGGSVENVTILNRSDLLTTDLILNAGQGGNGLNGNAGAGGLVENINMVDSSIANLVVDGQSHGDGGNSGAGIGGAGGDVSGLMFSSSRPDSIQPGNVAIASGAGGNGTVGGGAGGSILALQFIGTNFGYALNAGDGGAGSSGPGGAGGGLNQVGVSGLPTVLANALALPSGSATSGAGGAGSGGVAGAGGAGGDMLGVNLIAAGSVTLTSSNGGTGGGGSAGGGGSIITSSGTATTGSFSATAGSAGAVGSGSGNGGNINNLVVNASMGNLSMIAGAGSAGGAGGSISNSGTPIINNGSVTISAGAGSGQGNAAGPGGSISGYDGFIGTNGATAFTAGAGGSASGAAGAGGSITSVTLRGSSSTLAPPPTGPTLAVTFEAGEGGNTTSGQTGGAGGDVSLITVSSIPGTTVVHHVAAGDGGNGALAGGAGGSISHIHVGIPGEANSDIGLISGVAYGFTAAQVSGQFVAAGGLFAGAGGGGAQALGAPGNVTDVTAAAISSIVAGRGASPGFVGTVDQIYLEGNVTPAATSNGSFTNFNTANVVGSIVNPTAAGASTFHYTEVNGSPGFQAGDDPIDGLVAAVNLTSNRNFVPEALLTLSSTGQIVFVDLQEPNGPMVNT